MGSGLMPRLKLGFHISIFIIGFISVILHILFSPDPLVSTTKFTIHSNLIVSFTFLFSGIVLMQGKNEGTMLEFFKNCSLIYMAVNLLTYHFLLTSGGEYAGVHVITNFTVHYLIPCMVFINWLLFEVKKKYHYRYIFYWVFYPLLYTIVSSIRGLIDGFYPYFFLNPNGQIPVGVGSYTNVFLFMVAFLFVFVILGFLLIMGNRLVLLINNKREA
ncbi:Pr6Pr family membrane protein [Ornithinibacillus halotolerans]|uniref:Pr6Pr family membrane protein n=1 Tax=Ornithinibacillus halotolerans TaxID=1274357 RepID=A0A916S6L0_9BACI|nr:Pr6Pr family membrane protein [Ornithinibacillus halotolerans]GGA86864.1 hypothetical protein GCM10008025_32180 [Ornithinibacillus halotolerans]